MIAGLLQKIKKILTRNKFEKEEKERRSFQCTIQGDNVGMGRNGLMNGRLDVVTNVFFENLK